MPGQTHPGPHYISAAQYERVRRRRARRWSAAAFVLVVAAVALGVWFVRVPRIRSAEQLGAASLVARDPLTAHAVVWSFVDGEQVRQRDEWWTRELARIEFADTGIVVVKGHTEDTVWDPNRDEVRRHVFERYLPDARVWIADRFYRASLRKDLQRLPKIVRDRHVLSGYQYVEGVERFTLWVDDQGDQPVGVRVERRTSNGWQPVVEYAFEMGIALPPDLFTHPTKASTTIDFRGANGPGMGLQEVVASLPIGTNSSIDLSSVTVNREGTVFVAVKAASMTVPPYVTDDRGMVYFRSPETTYAQIPVVEYMFVPEVADSKRFAPRTIRVHIPVQQPSRLPPRDLAAFEMRAEEPGCTFAPRHRQFEMDADEQVRYLSEVVRGLHLETARRFPDGTLADVEDLRGRPLPEKFDVRDQAAAAAAYLRAIQIFRGSGAHRVFGPSLVWFRLFRLEADRGDPSVSEAYLESAALRMQEGESGPGAEEIFREWQLRRQGRIGEP